MEHSRFIVFTLPLLVVTIADPTPCAHGQNSGMCSGVSSTMLLQMQVAGGRNQLVSHARRMGNNYNAHPGVFGITKWYPPTDAWQAVVDQAQGLPMTLEECKQECSTYSTCLGLAFLDSGTCWLGSSLATDLSDQGLTMFVTYEKLAAPTPTPPTPTPPTPTPPIPGYDYTAHPSVFGITKWYPPTSEWQAAKSDTLAGLPMNLNECKQQCSTYSSCTGLAYLNSGTCWLGDSLSGDLSEQNGLEMFVTYEKVEVTPAPTPDATPMPPDPTPSPTKITGSSLE